MKTTLIASSVFIFSALGAFSTEEGFTPLFNGKNLDGWTKLGGNADYKVEGDAIVGTTAPNTPNTFLTTNKHYSNFDLRFEVKLDNDELNSGCQIRSNSSQDYQNGVVHGYQCEIESQHGTAGFIYDELRRGWLSTDRSGEQKQKAFRKGEWNKFRILCQGDSIKTWVNDIAIADVTDGLTSNGFIGLQVHNVPGDPHWQVRWKNIRIKELPSNPKKLEQLDDFKTIGNWKKNQDGSFQLHPRPGESGWERYASYLWAKEQYGDFVCSFEYMLDQGGNSGFYFHVKDSNNPVQTGIEIQLLDPAHNHSPLTQHDCGGIIFTRAPAISAAKPAKQWNKMEVRCEQNHLKVWLNGKKIQDMYLNNTGLKDRPLKGFLGFQDHGLPLKLRNILIENL